MTINLAYDQPSTTVHPELTAHSQKMVQTVYQVTDNYFLAYGFGLGSTHMIVGDDGVIIIDPNEDVGKCRLIKEKFDKITDKPIKAVIYTHMHADHIWGVKAFISQEDVTTGRCQVIAHETMLENYLASTANGVGPIIGVRSLYSFGNYLETGPEGLVNNGIGPENSLRESSFIPPSLRVGDYMDLNISGIKMSIFWVPSECDDEIAIWFPEMHLLCSAEVIQGETFPNLHTLRGTRYRDPRQWYKSIDTLRSYSAEIMVPSHGRPVHGKEKIEDILLSYRDAIQFVHNQTLRFMNMGYTADELVDLVRLPEHLAKHPWLGEFYGTIKHSVRQIYQGELGWFNGDPTTLDPISPIESANRYIKLMGGRAKLLKEAQAAFDSQDYQWVAEMTTYLIRVDKSDMNARQIKARSLRQLGFQTINSNWRCWYLTSADELDGRVFDDSVANLIGAGARRSVPVESKVEAIGLWLDGDKASDVQLTLGFHFVDLEVSYALEIRKGIAQFHVGLPSFVNATLNLKSRDLAGPGSLQKAIQHNKVAVDGNWEDVALFFSYFSSPKPLGEIKLTLR